MDSRLLEFISPLSENSILIALGDALNRLGKGDSLAFIFIILVLWGYVRGEARRLRVGGAGILVVTLSGIGVQSLKHLIGRARPGEHLGDFHFVGPNLHANGFDSFPSGHAMSSFAAAAFLSRFYPNLAWLFYSVAAAICLIGRVLFQHHFLTDVIAGGALGIFLGLYCAKKFKPWIDEK